MVTLLESIATANPQYRRTQKFAAGFMQRVESQPAAIRRRLPQIYAGSGIDFRYTCIEDYVREQADWDFFPRNWALNPAPSTARRNKKYREAAVPLAETVARDALAQADLLPGEITHVIAVSCTGFFAPGLDIELVKRLGLRPDTQRAVIGFMGCYAAFNALRVAHGFCQSQPGARVLMVCVELCTLHFQASQTLESAVVNALFSDGAAAAVLTSRSESEARSGLAYMDNHCLLDDDSMDFMTWDVGDTGFDMGLSSRVPSVIARHMKPFIETVLDRNGLATVDFWAIHPGGRAIVEKAQEELGLSDEAIHDSLEVLRLHGNMSSPTILFVLQRILARHQATKRGIGTGLAMAFGPGLTIEGCLWRGV